ncbi:MAG: hypothetical protein FJ294_04620 [Planctomycetes bacterium]|nr:hypothetical protein [Planctomycetota bacterium]
MRRIATHLALSLFASLLASGSSLAAGAGGGRPDQVFVKSKRDGSVSMVTGVVQRYELGKVTVAVGSKENNYDALQVQSVEWGDVPPSFREGHIYAARRSWADAAKSFRVAAGDASARDVVKAAAKRHLAETLIQGGGSDAARFTEAATEAQSYLAAFAANADVPAVRMLHARALWLSGKPAEAGAAYRGVHGEFKADATAAGYDPILCLQAGVQAARALLDGKDTLGAREVYAALESQVGPLLASDSLRKLELQAIADEAALGQGFVDLAGGQAKQALNFFQSRVNALKPDSAPTARFAAQLGLGEALLADNKPREASLMLAKVVGLDCDDRDRALRATVKLAEAYSKLPDADARTQACARVKDALNNAASAPASLRARQLAKDLGC